MVVLFFDPFGLPGDRTGFGLAILISFFQDAKPVHTSFA